MKLASGPLESGTYVTYAVVHPGQYHVIQRDNGDAKLALTHDVEDESDNAVDSREYGKLQV